MRDAIRLKLPRTIANGDGWGSSAGKSRVSVFAPMTSEARRPLWSVGSPSAGFLADETSRICGSTST
jgi:hypothetical protein